MPPRRSRQAGFTLIEMMVVVTILAAVLLLVPVNLYQFGAYSRLENAANTLVAVVGASRSQAILDGYPVRLEIGTYKDEDRNLISGHRWVVTNMPAERSKELYEDGEVPDEGPRPTEREWITTAWHPLPDGVKLAGISEQKDNWKKIREDRPYSVEFGPDGSVEKGFAVRVYVEKEDLDVSEEDRTLTIIVNPLTAEASSYEGLLELPPQRDENEFSK